MTTAVKLCECGCGTPTRLSSTNRPERGYMRGEPMRYANGHTASRGRPGGSKVERVVDGSVRKVWTGVNSRAKIHRFRAEKALGHSLPAKAEVHHVDESLSDDSPLVICQDHAYHMLLHRRLRIVRAGGNPDTDRVCGRCRRAKPICDFVHPHNAYCRPCHALNEKSRRPGSGEL